MSPSTTPTTITPALLQALTDVVGPDQVITQGSALRRGSQDFYWFSPVLKAQLQHKVGEVIVQPRSVDELLAVIALAVRAGVPITPRGAGTGNYGQSIPLQGGIIVNLRGLDRILEITADFARVEAGVLLHRLETTARQHGVEMRFYPSTLPTATAGGFLAGGSGGVGSVTWGTLWDDGNVLGATVATIEAEPRVLTITDAEELRGVVHNCGVTGIITDLTLAVAPARPWQQFVAAFDNFETALRFGETLAYDDALPKRLVTVLEWPIPSFFGQLINAGAVPDGKALMLLHLDADAEQVRSRVQAAGGQVTWHDPDGIYRPGKLMLTDFSWNHTTLWAIKADEELTYLQDQFDPARVYEQLRLRKARYGDRVLEHMEFMKFLGRMVPQGLTLVRATTKEELHEITAYCESIGIWTADPHTHFLDEDVRWNGQPILDAKAAWDPHGLLNPGHLKSLEQE